MRSYKWCSRAETLRRCPEGAVGLAAGTEADVVVEIVGVGECFVDVAEAGVEFESVDVGKLDLRKKGRRDRRGDEWGRLEGLENWLGDSEGLAERDYGDGRRPHVRNWDGRHVMTLVHHSARKEAVCCAE